MVSTAVAMGKRGLGSPHKFLDYSVYRGKRCDRFGICLKFSKIKLKIAFYHI